MFLNYPNNPTGGVIEDDFFARVVEFARRNDIIVVHDNAYSEITYDGYRAPSFLETPGRDGRRHRDLLALEDVQHDRLAGRRRGRQPPTWSSAYWQLKTNIDSGMFEALQEAAAAALRSDQSLGGARCARSTSAAATCWWPRSSAIGLRVDPPKGAIYVWARVPDGRDLGVVHRAGARGRRRGDLARAPPTAPAARASCA